MSLFQCPKCGCEENTALGSIELDDKGNFIWADGKHLLRLCSACSTGTWHGQWKRTFYPKGTVFTDHHGNLTGQGLNEPSDTEQNGTEEPPMSEQEKKPPTVLKFPIAQRLMAEMRVALKNGDVSEITRLYFQMFPGDLPCQHAAHKMWCEICKDKSIEAMPYVDTQPKPTEDLVNAFRVAAPDADAELLEELAKAYDRLVSDTCQDMHPITARLRAIAQRLSRPVKKEGE